MLLINSDKKAYNLIKNVMSFLKLVFCDIELKKMYLLVK